MRAPWASQALLPQKVVWFGSTTGSPKELRPFIEPQYQDQPFLLFSNFAVPTELRDLLHVVMAEVNCGRPEFGWDADKLRALLALQEECLRVFNQITHEGAAAPAGEASLKKTE